MKEEEIAFKAFTQSSLKRKKFAVFRELYPEVQRYMDRGYALVDITEALNKQPYNLSITLATVKSYLYRIRNGKDHAEKKMGVAAADTESKGEGKKNPLNKLSTLKERKDHLNFDNNPDINNMFKDVE